MRSTVQRIHHIAYVVRDQGATRHFYEDVLGFPLVATWAEIGPFPGFGDRMIDYCHTFFALPDGSALSFFAFSDEEVYRTLRNRNGIAHVAITATPDQQTAMREHLERSGYHPLFVDHGYVQSLYVQDPDHLQVEFTTESSNSPNVATWQQETAHDTLARWLAGDHTPNNDMRHT